MSGFFWNIRGFNKTNKHSVVKDWVRSNSFQFGGLLETKVKERKAMSIVNTVFQGWNMVSNYECHHLGRIWVVWAPQVQLQVIYKSSQLLTCIIKIPSTDTAFCCSFVYASNSADERKDLWRDLQIQHDNAAYAGTPWIIFGDFNETLALSEHSNSDSLPMVTAGMRDFQEAVQYCSLLDMRTHGPPFTWCNKREEGLISKKLDRVLQNVAWSHTFSQSYCSMEPGGCSDHLRGRILLSSNVHKPTGPFKFTNAIATQPEFMPTMTDFWSGTTELFHSTSSLHRLSKKLKLLKPVMRNLSRQKLSDISRRAADAYEDLCQKQLLSLTNSNPQAVADEKRAFERWERVASLEEGYLKQRSKLHWLRVGDKNNRYFYMSAKERQSRNSIHTVNDPTGAALTQIEDIKAEAVRFFSTLLTQLPTDFSQPSLNRLRELLPFRCSPQQHEQMLSDVTEEEVKKVLFSMPMNKSPGPDGYTTEFFKHAWSVVGKDVIIAIQSFFRFGFLPKGLNATILALIPKKTDANEMKDYRPISCCNVLYKVISKIIANRLKRILPSFIAPNQSAFIKDRLLMENLLLATELVKDYHKETVSSRCAMKIDISKAFDSVQWSFLLNVLSAMNFPQQFIHWINLCISTASFSVQVNGELSGFFKSERGLRQGCPLSPYLFVICMNVLSAMLDKSALAGKFGYHPKCQAMSLTHLCFADDIMVFSNGTVSSMKGILEIFDEFACISGLRISIEKSTLFIAGTHTSARDAILAQFPFECGSLPVRYLGLPLMTKRMSLADCTPLIEKIRTRIGSWKHRFLSYAGRLQLLSSVIASLTNFWISAFRLPSACITEIEKLCSAFLWSGPELNTRKAKLAWAEVCKPKKEGGLGLKSIHEANKVSCFKLIWRLMSQKQSLWVNWVQRQLIRAGSFWSIKDGTSLGSWMWKKLLKYRAQAKLFYHSDIQSGQQTSFWYEHWCQLGILHDILGDRGFIDLGIRKEGTVADALRRRPRHHRNPLLNQIEDELSNLRNRVLLPGMDTAQWRQLNGQFKSTFSFSETWEQIRVLGPSQPWHTSVWFSGATPKFSFHQWLTTRNRLATGDRMTTWNPGADSTCIFCHAPMESRDHLFFMCPFSSHVWTTLAQKLLQQHFTVVYTEILARLNGSTFTGSTRFVIRYALQATLYAVWQERNKRRHGEVPQSSTQLIARIDRQVRNQLLSLQQQESRRFDDGLRIWFQAQL